MKFILNKTFNYYSKIEVPQLLNMCESSVGTLELFVLNSYH